MSEKDRQQGDGEKRERIQIFEREYSRRDVLKTAGAAGLVAGLSGILAACGGGSGDGGEAPPATTAAAGVTTREPPRRAPATTAAEAGPVTGGRLRVGHVGGGKAESFNPATGSTFIDASALLQPLRPARSRQPGPRDRARPRASSGTPNSDSTE